ncbi:hypothetical protein [Pelagibaculum spongiae]|uniref:Uncharacterized protein n=1 Tax=Pelagibaculum spongiae TaxID=2080658 RepID=A0A2V1GU50_9GAMM|nr:hypothetical protein [Pelagibaculum spongiae]PVZ69539.1 hypothetical protein DC094_09465 [Pelagibaculum spongiae]
MVGKILATALKVFEIFVKLVAAGILIILLLVVADYGYCRYMLFTAVESDELLTFYSGKVYLKDSKELFTGNAYSTLCGGECGLFVGCPSIHSLIHYQDGIKKGVAYYPPSQRADDYFIFGIFETEPLKIIH